MFGKSVIEGPRRGVLLLSLVLLATATGLAQDMFEPYRSANRPRALMMSGSPSQSAEFPRRALSSVLTTANIPVTFIENPQALDREALSHHNLFIQSGSIRITPEQEQALWDFVENGGSFLALNMACDGPRGGPYEKLLGGSLIRRPAPYGIWIHVTDAGRKHPIMSGIMDFEIFDEQLFVRYNVDPPAAAGRRGQAAQSAPAPQAVPGAPRDLAGRGPLLYRPSAATVHVLFSGYAMDNGTDLERTVLGNGGVTEVVAGWWQEIGKGRMCYLAPGHTSEIMNHPTMQHIYQNAVKWLVRMD